VPIGRTDRQVKINGIRVEPGETETALRACPEVADAAVIVLDEVPPPRLVACVVPRQGHDDATLAQTLREALIARLPRHQVPAEIRIIGAIPLLPSLKPDLAALRALGAGEPQPASGVIARTLAGLRGRA
jgi:acyl-coenzyme A synthetase/AMP-(fatty) acid ligase